MNHISPSGRAALTLAALFYGLFTIGAFIWSYSTRPGTSGLWPGPFVPDPALASWGRTAAGVALGLLIGLATVGGSRLLVRWVGWARELHRWFAQVLGPLSSGRVLALALLSSVGEELLFRGAIQPQLGLWLTTLIFGLLHIPQRLKLLPWTVMALVIGLVFGWLTLWSGSVAGATMAHFVINLLNLHQITHAASRPEKLPPQDRPPSMGAHEAPLRAPVPAPPPAVDHDPDGAPPGTGRGAEP